MAPNKESRDDGLVMLTDLLEQFNDLTSEEIKDTPTRYELFLVVWAVYQALLTIRDEKC